MFELAKAYEAKEGEKRLYRFWEEGGFFRADPSSSKPPFCIVIPPPNVTGMLHMGHALDNTLQDILIRFRRMCGDDVLWMPGCDHAGIATQTVVERHLLKTEGKRRYDFQREEFLRYVLAWKETSEKAIVEQLKALGCSCDWSRARFTMDTGFDHAVRVMFKKLFDDGLIFRDYYLVNWDPGSRTALADDEVEYEEREGFIWYFSYPLQEGDGSISVATTRPETMLGDVAVAVSGKDLRYRALVGKAARHPVTGRILPIIADDAIDPTFGTGAVKITPAHDHVDYQIGIRHNLPAINILNDDGTINEHGGHYAGRTTLEARQAIVEEMKERGCFLKQEPHTFRVGLSYRSKAIIEPYLSKQWFVRLSAFKDTLHTLVSEKKTELIPAHWDHTYFHWIDNLRDWCISRQLWWGHRIPIWYDRDNPQNCICHAGEGVPQEAIDEPDRWVQDPDVLDTWFSAALWPLATLGWPERTIDFAKYYPTSILITGHDILFFWVARMMMMGQYATGQPPFPKVFLHGLIFAKSYWRLQGSSVVYVTGEERKQYDLGKTLPPDIHFRWEKMSKSKGNVIDPTEISQEYGTDAMRLALTASVTDTRHIDLDLRRFEEFRNFANKVWNGARFVFMNIDAPDATLSPEAFSRGLAPQLFTLEDRWILHRLNSVTEAMHRHLTACAFDKAAMLPYEFFWDDFCAQFLEIVKPVLSGKQGDPAIRENKQKILVIVLLQVLRLMHPIAPFITEELFGLLKKRFEGVAHDAAADPYTKEAVAALLAPACIVAPYPRPQSTTFDGDAQAKFDLMSEVVRAIRNIRAELKVPLQLATEVYITATDTSHEWEVVKKHVPIIAALVKTSAILFEDSDSHHASSSTAVVGPLKIRIPLPEALMVQEQARLAKEEATLVDSVGKLQNQLENTQFLEKAPEALIQKLKGQLEKSRAELAVIRSRMRRAE